MQHLWVSGAVRPLKWPLGIKWLNAGPSASQGNQHHPSLVDIRPFPKEGVGKETRKRMSRMNAALTDTLVMAALELEVQAHCKPVKRNRLFSSRNEN
jgi:hypothetical protein